MFYSIVRMFRYFQICEWSNYNFTQIGYQSSTPTEDAPWKHPSCSTKVTTHPGPQPKEKNYQNLNVFIFWRVSRHLCFLELKHWNMSFQPPERLVPTVVGQLPKSAKDAGFVTRMGSWGGLFWWIYIKWFLNGEYHILIDPVITWNYH